MLLRRGHSALAEAVARATLSNLQVPETAGALLRPSNSLDGPVVRPLLGLGVCAGCAPLLLEVVRDFAAAPAHCVADGR